MKESLGAPGTNIQKRRRAGRLEPISHCKKSMCNKSPVNIGYWLLVIVGYSRWNTWSKVRLRMIWCHSFLFAPWVAPLRHKQTFSVAWQGSTSGHQSDWKEDIHIGNWDRNFGATDLPWTNCTVLFCHYLPCACTSDRIAIDRSRIELHNCTYIAV